MKEKTSKHDQYVEAVAKFAAYVNTKELVVGIYCSNEDYLIANKSVALKKLVKTFKYKIQTVIK